MDSDCIRSTNLLLLPGMMCDARLWRPQAEALAEQLSVQVADLTAHDSIAALAAEVLDRAPPCFALAGLSMGGIVALEMWRQAPDRIERLALLDTNFRAELPERQMLRGPQLATVAAGGLERVLRDELLPNYLAASRSSDPLLRSMILEMGLGLGPQVFGRQSIALRDRPDSTATLADIHCPTLVLCGDEDRLCPPELHREMAQRLSASVLQVIPDCGHLSTLEQPELVTAALRRWLEA